MNSLLVNMLDADVVKKLSIIIPVYNLEDSIGFCLDSCLRQDIPEYEIVCVDDGSTDNSAEVINSYIKKFPDKVRLYQKPNGGVSSARNFGIGKATGEWIWFIDGDDYIAENCLKTLSDALSEDDSILMFCAENVNEYKNVTFESDFITEKIMRSNLFDMSTSGSAGACSYWFRRDVLINGELRFDQTMKYSEDILFVFEYFMKCSRQGVLIHKAIYFYYQRENSAMHSVNYNEHYYCMNKLLSVYSEYGKTAQDDYEREVVKRKIRGSIRRIQFDLLFKIRDFDLSRQKIGELHQAGLYPIKKIKKSKKRRKKKAAKNEFVMQVLYFLFNIKWIYLLMCRFYSKKIKK